MGSLRPILPCLAVLAALWISGCGYHIAGKAGQMPGGIKSLTIPVFENGTRKPDIESIITAAFVDEFVTTVNVLDAGEAVMEGVIKSYELKPVSYTKDDVNQEYRLTVTVSLNLLGAGTDAILWSDENVVDYEDFIVNTSDVTATEEAEIEALRKLARDTARAVKERMLERF